MRRLHDLTKPQLLVDLLIASHISVVPAGHCAKDLGLALRYSGSTTGSIFEATVLYCSRLSSEGDDTRGQAGRVGCVSYVWALVCHSTYVLLNAHGA